MKAKAIDYDLPKTQSECKKKLKEMFMKNKDVKDIRIIDALVIKCFWDWQGGQMELKETVQVWKQKHGIMAFWAPTVEPKPKDFMGKFLDGHN
ncbi:hypothetical protein HAZT_HAZT002132 [Hyalella azteca]|uniref:Uncharacterized protein n=1 Tax=Hyalella azteca TaxID=294128 RepID=A0A6A0GSM2_HYAAZ|nr:hypothetical protein HAZT_HAZT002132 [Hyalella azteca]